jgi:Na+/H+ antiporter NhaA
MLLGASTGAAQPAARGPTIAAARAGVSVVSTETSRGLEFPDATAHCGSAFKNAVLLGLGLSLAVGVIELTYTIVREPLARNGHDLPHADPMLIAWAGGAGFVVGLVGTELCRRRGR